MVRIKKLEQEKRGQTSIEHMDILRIEPTLRMAGMIMQDLVNFLIMDTQKIIGLLVEDILNIVYLIGHQKNIR